VGGDAGDLRPGITWRQLRPAVVGGVAEGATVGGGRGRHGVAPRGSRVATRTPRFRRPGRPFSSIAILAVAEPGGGLRGWMETGFFATGCGVKEGVLMRDGVDRRWPL